MYSEEEKKEMQAQIEKSIIDGIVCIDELLKVKEFKLIKNTLNETPIHIVEILYSMFKKEEWKKLFQFAVDNQNTMLADYVIKRDTAKIEQAILSYWSSPKADSPNINQKHFYLYVDGRKQEMFRNDYGIRRTDTAKNYGEIVGKLNAVKQRIIEELSYKFDKKKIIGELTKEYLNFSEKKKKIAPIHNTVTIL